MYMKFFTNVPEPRIGFKALFEIADNKYEYKDERGFIASRNYPNPGGYKPNSITEYYFSYALNQRINITFTDVDLPFSPNLLNESDYITISNIFTNYNNETEQEVMRIYGNVSLEKLPNIISDTSKSVVRFYTFKPSTYRKYRGFKFNFQRIFGACSREVFDSSGELSLRNMKTYTCIWRINAPKGQRIKVEVDDIEYFNEKSSLRLRFYDDFEMTIPLATYEKAIAGSISPVSSSDNRMLIMLNTNRVDGFSLKFLKLHWSSDESTICPHTEDNVEGSLSVTNIGDNLKCVSKFTLNRNETLSVKIEELVIGQRSNVRLVSSFPEIGVRIGSTLLKNNISSTTVIPVTGIYSSIQIIQRNNSATSLKSFKGRFRKHPCGGVFTSLDATTIILSKIKDSDGSVRRDYGEIDCFWNIWISTTQLNITISPELQFTGNCNEEYIRFYRGSIISSPFIQSFCGENSTSVEPLNIGKAYQLAIHYHSNQYNPENQVKFTIASAFNCGGKKRFNSVLYDVHRLNFKPRDYRNDLECIWEFSTEGSYNLELSFYDRFYIGKFDFIKKILFLL